MKYLIFGDVHGNLPALEKLFEIEEGNYDQFISHGDVVNYGPWSNECVNFLQNKQNGILLMGNHEENYLKGIYTGTHPIAQAFFSFCYPKFNSNNFEIIRNYSPEKKINNFLIKHTIDGKYIFLNTNIEELEINSNYIIGHSHQQFERKKNNYKIYNTGSLGQNRSFINQACYLIYNSFKNTVELKSFTFDINIILKEMIKQQYPEICINYYKEKAKLA